MNQVYMAKRELLEPWPVIVSCQILLIQQRPVKAHYVDVQNQRSRVQDVVDPSQGNTARLAIEIHRLDDRKHREQYREQLASDSPVGEPPEVHGWWFLGQRAPKAFEHPK